MRDGRNADADRRHDRVPADLGGGVGKHHADAFGQRKRGRLAFFRQQDGEFLAAEAARKIVRAEATVQRRGEDRQHPVADRVAVDVVDRLEAIEIGDQHGDRRAARRAPGDRRLRVDHERAPVRQSGERIDQRRDPVAHLGALLGHRQQQEREGDGVKHRSERHDGKDRAADDLGVRDDRCRHDDDPAPDQDHHVRDRAGWSRASATATPPRGRARTHKPSGRSACIASPR